MKKLIKTLFIFSFSFLFLTGCSDNNSGNINNDGDNQDNTDSSDDDNFNKEEDKPEDMNGILTISFDSCGGTKIKNQYVKANELATKPTDPIKTNYTFGGWYLSTEYIKEFSFDTKITTDYCLFAKRNSTSSSGDDSGSTGDNTGDNTGGNTDSGDKTTSKGHGPDGSTLVSWYLVGSGSLWDESNGWTIAGGVQLYSNPNNSADKGCILSISFKVGDIFKVTDGGSNWFGYEKVNTWSDASNKGLSSFSGDSDGYGGNNFKCIVEGTYDMYVNSSGTFWIQDATK